MARSNLPIPINHVTCLKRLNWVCPKPSIFPNNQLLVDRLDDPPPNEEKTQGSHTSE